MRAQIITRAAWLVVLTLLLLCRTQPAGAARYYPEDDRVAEYIGTTVVRVNDTLGRTYSAAGTVRARGAAGDIKPIAATNAAISVLFSIPGSAVYLPLVTSP
jgi:hypothetical protein